MSGEQRMAANSVVQAVAVVFVGTPAVLNIAHLALRQPSAAVTTTMHTKSTALISVGK